MFTSISLGGLNCGIRNELWRVRWTKILSEQSVSKESESPRLRRRTESPGEKEPHRAFHTKTPLKKWALCLVSK